VSIVFGVLVFLFSGAGAVELVWLISAYAIASGILLLVAACRLRRHPDASSHEGLSKPALDGEKR
jgi:uncharacterized membrane protein HdeD (DUF308 family)